MKAFLILHFTMWALVVAVGGFAVYSFSGSLPKELFDIRCIAYSHVRLLLFSFPTYCVGRFLVEQFNKTFKRT